MSATATKAAPKSATKSGDRLSAEDMCERIRDQAANEDRAFDEMKTRLVTEHAGELTEAEVYLARNQQVVFEHRGFKSREEICIELRRHRATLNLRSKYGDPAILKRARVDLAAREEELRTTRAEAADLEAPDFDGPVLRKQIKLLTERLTTLTVARDEAQRLVAEIEQGRKTLAGRAPRWMVEECDRENNRVKWNHPAYVGQENLVPKIKMLESVIESWDRQSVIDTTLKNPTHRLDQRTLAYTQYAETYLPEAVSSRSGGRADSVSISELERHIPEVRDELERLKTQHAALTAEWEKCKAEIHAPVTRWVETGQFD